MKKLLLLLLLASSLATKAQVTNKLVILSWRQIQYNNEVGNNMYITNTLFKFYTQTNLFVPKTNWDLTTTYKPGTNLSLIRTNGSNYYVFFMTNGVFPGEHFWYMSCSNFWGDGGEYINFTNVAFTPPLPDSDNEITISKGW